jgi:hypothetical protein
MTKKIDDIIIEKYNNTIRYFLNKLKNTIRYSLNKPNIINIERLKHMTKEEVYKSEEIKNLLCYYTYVNRELKYNIDNTLTTTINLLLKLTIKHDIKKFFPDNLNKLLSSIVLQIHIYKNFCSTKSIITGELCEWNSMKHGGMCISHHIYYTSRQDLIKYHIDKDTTSIVMKYLIE